MGWIWNLIHDLLIVVKILEALYLLKCDLHINFPLKKVSYYQCLFEKLNLRLCRCILAHEKGRKKHQ